MTRQVATAYKHMLSHAAGSDAWPVMTSLSPHSTVHLETTMIKSMCVGYRFMISAPYTLRICQNVPHTRTWLASFGVGDCSTSS
jgi:hypothetical protein